MAVNTGPLTPFITRLGAHLAEPKAPSFTIFQWTRGIATQSHGRLDDNRKPSHGTFESILRFVGTSCQFPCPAIPLTSLDDAAIVVGVGAFRTFHRRVCNLWRLLNSTNICRIDRCQKDSWETHLWILEFQGLYEKQKIVVITVHFYAVNTIFPKPPN